MHRNSCEHPKTASTPHEGCGVISMLMSCSFISHYHPDFNVALETRNRSWGGNEDGWGLPSQIQAYKMEVLSGGPSLALGSGITLMLDGTAFFWRLTFAVRRASWILFCSWMYGCSWWSGVPTTCLGCFGSCIPFWERRMLMQLPLPLTHPGSNITYDVLRGADTENSVQLVQNVAARMLTRARRIAHITSNFWGVTVAPSFLLCSVQCWFWPLKPCTDRDWGHLTDCLLHCVPVYLWRPSRENLF